MKNRIAYAQNYFRSPKLVQSLIDRSSITSDDVVIDIGAGTGLITQALVRHNCQVIAFELDKNLAQKLSQRFTNPPVKVIQGDFLKHALPEYPYKIFANIPFSQTAAIITKLTRSSNPPLDCYLVVQKEAAKKYIGQPLANTNSQMAILLKPWFDFTVVHHFNQADFIPMPSVYPVLLRISKKSQPLIYDQDKPQFIDFIIYAFNQTKPDLIEGLTPVMGKETLIKLSREFSFSPHSKPSQLEFAVWLKLFNYFLTQIDPKHQNTTSGAAAKQFKHQQALQKIHRTRTDPDWKIM